MSFKGFKPYPKYKDSGVEWLGEVPEHWEVKRLRFVAKFNPSKTEADRLDRSTEVSFLPMEAIGNDGSLDLERTRPIGELETGYTYFREGDVTIAKITPCFENGKGAIMRGLLGGIGFGTTELIVARPKVEKTTSQYLYQIFISSPFRKFGEAAMYGAGGQKRVPDDFIQDFSTAFPPLSEQLAIASFLGQETSRIDTLISEKERLIFLLQEYRQALISHVVTKGLDPTVKVKDSGVDWVGEVPNHWEVLKLKYLATIWGGGTPSKLKQEFWEGDIPWVSPKDLKSNAIDDTEDHITKEAVLESSTQIIPSQTVLIVVRSGILQHTIPIAINTVPVALNQDMKAILFNEMINPLYFLYLVTGLESLLLLEWRKKGPTVESIESEYLLNTFIPVPPIFEQNSIAATLLEKTSRIDILISEAKKFIDLLKEYRSSLITAAVTGKINVLDEVESS